LLQRPVLRIPTILIVGLQRQQRRCDLF
jgi:hypothetical protein